MRIYDRLSLFFTSYLNEFSEEWDLLLNDIIGNGELVKVDRHTAYFKVGSSVYCIWISNKWYSYGYLYRVVGERDLKFNLRPRAKTMLLLSSVVDDYFNKKRKEELKSIKDMMDRG